MPIIAFRDEEEIFGMIDTEISIREIRALLDEFWASRDEGVAGLCDFYAFLHEKGVVFTRIPHEADVELYF